MHPRIGLHQVAMMGEGTQAFLDHCHALGVRNVTVVSPKLFSEELPLIPDGMNVASLNHLFAVHPDLERDAGEAAGSLSRALAIARALGAKSLYLLTGGRGSLDWDAAAERFATLIAPFRECGIPLLIENASALNADIHMAHTLRDTIELAEQAGIGLCIDLHSCWAEAGLASLFRRASPLIGLVQPSDYILGDRSTPCRAVPGDGAIPLERLIGELLEAGYQGVFDIELLGPRIETEGPRIAIQRAAEHMSEILVRLGA